MERTQCSTLLLHHRVHCCGVMEGVASWGRSVEVGQLKGFKKKNLNLLLSCQLPDGKASSCLVTLWDGLVGSSWPFAWFVPWCVKMENDAHFSGNQEAGRGGQWAIAHFTDWLRSCAHATSGCHYLCSVWVSTDRKKYRYLLAKETTCKKKNNAPLLEIILAR